MLHISSYAPNEFLLINYNNNNSISSCTSNGGLKACKA